MKHFICFFYLLLLNATKLYSIEYERIYAIMITGKDKFHEELAKCSIKSFLEQTYPNKHLIIINDGNYVLRPLSKEITEIRLDKKYLLGTLRNIGLEQIPENAVWIQWDDDDWHHPRLIEEQYSYLLSQNADLCVLKKQVQYAFNLNSAWILNGIIGIGGTIMCRKKNNIWYQDLSKNEDSYFFYTYKKKYKSVIWENPPFYYIRLIHGHNTWDADHFKLKDRIKNKWNISSESKKYLSTVLPYYNCVKR